MASSREYLEFVLDQLSQLNGIAYKKMMGEYVISFRGKIVGGVYDDRFLIKATEAAARLMPDAPKEPPYPGAKEMILVVDVDNRELMTELVAAVAEDLPEPKRK